jgi:hypothetical protein
MVEERQEDRVDIQKYSKYIVDISILKQTVEFILPLFNLYKKTRVAAHQMQV